MARIELRNGVSGLIREGEAREGLWEDHRVWKAAGFYHLREKWLERLQRVTEGIVNMVQPNVGIVQL